MTNPTLTKTHRWPPDLYEEIEALAKGEKRPTQQLLIDLLRIGLEHYQPKKDQGRV